MKTTIILALLLSPGTVCAGWQEKVAKRTVESTVQVKIDGRLTGSGVVLGRGRQILTCAHLFDTPTSTDTIITITTAQGATYDVELSYLSVPKDLALLTMFSNVRLPALTLAPVDSIRLGESVLVVGHPLGLSWTVNQGSVSAVRRDVGLPNLYVQTTASIAPGCSGGPLVDRHGRVIGIAALARTDFAGFYLAVHIEEIYAFIREAWTLEKLHHLFPSPSRRLNQLGDQQ